MLQTSLYHNTSNWATKVKTLLYTMGFSHVLVNQGVENDKLFSHLFKQRARETFIQNGTVNYKTRLELRLIYFFQTFISNFTYM